MEQIPLTIRSKSPDFQRFCQYKSENFIKSLEHINPLTLGYLLPDKVKGKVMTLNQKVELLNTNCCVLEKELPLFLSVQHNGLQIEYKNDNLISTKTALIMQSDCVYLKPCPHRFRINNFQPAFRNFMATYREGLIKNLPKFIYIKPPAEVLTILPDMVLGHPLSSRSKEELIAVQYTRLSNDKVLYLNFERNSLVVLPLTPEGKIDFSHKTYPVVRRSEVSFSWEHEERSQTILKQNGQDTGNQKNHGLGGGYSMNT